MAAGKNILLLEDSPTAMALLQSSLKNAIPNATLFSATSVDAAQKIAAANEIDLFILDVHLPDGTGLEFLTDMKMVHPNALAIVVTATPLPGYRDYASRMGAVSFLEKPIVPERFREFVVALMNVGESKGDGYAGTLRDLSVTDIVQIKCLGGQETAVEFGGPVGQTGTVVFQKGRISHAHVGNLTGIDAFNFIVRWPGGKFREVPPPAYVPQTIKGDWQMLLMDAIRAADEAKAKGA